jgi:uncharacterized protein YecE (DUF72 family)
MPGTIHIGTSGWHYDHWRGPFYPPDLSPAHFLAFYAERFATVEINNSFYRMPSPAALATWRDATPPSFRFAVKGSRYLTHMKKLKDPETGLANFLPRLEALGEKLGPILFQLPPHWRADPERLAAFLTALPASQRFAFELRDPSWHVPAIYERLAHHNAACCIYDLAGRQSPVALTADFVYVRLHGPDGAYQGCYDLAALAAWARRVREWADTMRAVYVYFDNDERGYAPSNALTLRALVDQPAAGGGGLGHPAPQEEGTPPTR